MHNEWGIALGLVAGLALSTAAKADDEIPFADAVLFFELNDTDGDLGIHMLADGEPWKRLVLEDPNERRMLDIRLRGRLGQQGLTELFYESAEPTFDELDPEDFFRRFPEGLYELEGLTLEGEELESELEITHLLPAPPTISVNGEELAGSCDAVQSVASSGDSVRIEWSEIDESHPTLGRTGEPIEVDNYQVAIELPDGDLSFDFEDATEVELSTDIVPEGEEIKIEVLVREESGNQTATESCFELE